MAYVLAILALSLLIVIHELGHMLVARLFGMRVTTFSVGFGPPLVRWRGRRTTYQLALVPLGGFVQIAGMNPHERLPADDPGSYMNKSRAARVLTILAGPLTNYIASMLVIIVVMLVWGAPQPRHEVGEVEARTPAARAGVRPGDVIERIDGQPTPGIPEVLERINASQGRAIRIEVEREGKSVQLVATPERRKEGPGYRIGVGFRQRLAFTEVGPGAAVVLGVIYPIHESGRALGALGRIFSNLAAGKPSEQQVGGPVEVVHQLSLSFRASLVMTLIFLAMLSAYLGLFNLLPVPALDGGRLLFLLSTIIARREVNQRFENLVHTVGFVLLLGLLLMVTYCDVARRLGGP